MIKIFIEEFIIKEIHVEPGFNKNDDVVITMRRCLEKGLSFRTHTTDILKLNIEICIVSAYPVIHGHAIHNWSIIMARIRKRPRWDFIIINNIICKNLQ